MKSWRTRLLVGAASAAALVAIPALSQNRDGPESLLPPGFGNSEDLPPPAEKAAPPQVTPVNSAAASAPGAPTTAPQPGSPEDQALDPLETPQPTNYFSVPKGAARPVNAVGVLDPGNNGMGMAAFGNANGAFLAALMHEIDAPLPSRWTSILLRRALLSRAEAPAQVNPVDWVAARVDLLLRMGEADAARMLVESVDRENYTPRMIQAAAQTALANADPAALCPLVQSAKTYSGNPVWTLADAMCAALEGEATRASALADEARRRSGAQGIDLMLAQKVIGAGANARRTATIEWEGVDSLNPWRFGLASATGAAIPAPLMASAGPRYQAWLARAPMLAVDDRLDAAGIAAALGVFSSRSLGEAYSLSYDIMGSADAAGTPAERLRRAWIEPDPAARIAAMRALWDEPRDPLQRYARRILTAGAAAHIQPSEDHAADAADLIASMLSAGMDGQAARWTAIAGGNGDDRAWALLAVGSPRAGADLSAGRIESFIDADTSADKQRAKLLVAALAGLGRIEAGSVGRLAGAAGLPSVEDRWTRMIDAAATARQPGTVALLAATGMQAADWRGVAPAYLFHIVRALHAVGLDQDARMIAAEAIART